jgi:hypothetical protein
MLLMTAAIVTLGVALGMLSTASTGWTQEAAQRAYTTGHPGKADWLGLATPDGRYEIALGEGCDGIGPDMNVLLAKSDESNEAQWTLQLPDHDQVCTVAEWHWMGNAPCEQNADGVCDVAEA